MLTTLDRLAADWRIAFRSLSTSRLSTGVILATVVAAIGLSTAVFSLVSSVLIRPLPYPESDRLVRLAEFRSDREPRTPASGGRLTAVTIGLWQNETTTLEALIPYSFSSSPVGAGGSNEQIMVATVGPQFFEIVGAHPAAGRLLSRADHKADAEPVAVISRRYWRGILGGRNDVEGSVITIDDLPHTVVGIAPDGIAFPAREVDVWKPGRWKWPLPGGRSNIMMSIDAIGRMRPGATVEDVRREGERIVRAIAFADPAFADGLVQIPAVRAVRLLDDMVVDTRPALSALLAGMALVLVAACASLANLLAARNSGRARALAIKVTLGAGRARLLRPLVFEYFVIAFSGTALGALGGWWILEALPAMVPTSLPRLEDVRLDWRGVATASALASATLLVVGARPGWRRQKTNLRELSSSSRVPSRGGSRSAEVFRGALVSFQVALAVVLLIGAALIGQSMVRLLRTSPGYQPGGLLTFQVGQADLAFRDKGRLTRFYNALLERILAMPEVTAAGVASKLPLHSFGFSGTFRIEGLPMPTDPAERPRAHMHVVSTDYLSAMGTRLLAGRAFDKADALQSVPVVLVDELLARRHFAGDAIGKKIISIGGKPWTIIGVVETVKLASVAEAAEPILYFPNTQVGEVLAYNRMSGGVVVRTASVPSSLVPAVREYVRELDPSATIFNIMPLSERLDRTFDQPRFFTLALLLFAALTVATAVLGVYGVQAYTVERRRGEFGVRRALGADERHILTFVLRRAAALAIAGLATGLPLAALGVGLLQTLLFGIRPLDPLTFVLAAGGTFVLVIAASWQPARRALAIDPAEALRSE